MRAKTKKVFIAEGLIILLLLGIMLIVSSKKEAANIKASEKEAFDYLLENSDLSPVQVAGIVATIRQQSNFNTSVHEDIFTCTGLMCWTTGREQQLFKFAESKGKEVTDFYLQLDFILEELKGSSEYASYQLADFNGYTIEDWHNVKTPEETAVIFTYLYVKPGIIDTAELQTLAREIYDAEVDSSKSSHSLVAFCSSIGKIIFVSIYFYSTYIIFYFYREILIHMIT